MISKAYKARWRVAVAIALSALVMASCNCESEPEVVDDTDVDEVEEQQAEVDEDDERPKMAFGLPLPPEYDNIRQEEQRVRVTTSMNLDELEAFYAREVVDYEILRPGTGLRVEPLRSHSARIEASHFRGPRSHVVVNYRRPPEPDSTFYQGPPLKDEAESEDQGPERDQAAAPAPRRDQRAMGPDVVGERPGWLDDIKGEPVELRTRDGDLLAPGAKWGEAYTPPEGSPLDQERFRHNFGRPFGDWRSR